MDYITDKNVFQRQLINLASDGKGIYESANSWFIEQGSEISSPALVKGLDDKGLGSICHWRILRLLEYFAKEEYIPAILKTFQEALKNRDFILIHGAMEALSAFCTPSATNALITALQENNLDIVKHAAALLGRTGDLSAIEPLSNLLKSNDPSLRYSATRGLVQLDSPLVLNYLTQHLQTETDSEIRKLILSEIQKR